MNLYTHAESNTRKTWLYLTVFFLLIIGVGWLLSYVLGNASLLWIAIVLSFLMTVGSYWYSDKLALALSHAKPIQKSDSPELYRIVENLSITAGLPMPRLYIIQDPQPNAFATGRNANHGVVAVTSGLLERLERVELEGVLAHEISHIGNKDILISTIVIGMVGALALVSDFYLRFVLSGGLRDRERSNVLVVALLSAAIFALAMFAAQAIKFAISRKREFLADASGALLTRYPDGLARALEKIAADPHQLRSASDATAHLYIASPFRGKEKTSWIHKLFMTHPPVEERVAALHGMKVWRNAPSAI